MTRLAKFAILTVVFLSGCALSTGQQGNLGFAYHASDTLLSNSLQHSIEAGGEVDILVYAPKDSTDKDNYRVVNDQQKLKSAKSELVTVELASSSNPNVLKVLAVKGKQIRLRGVSAGVAELSVKTARGSDTIQVRVAELGHVEVDHWAWKKDGAVGPGQSVLLNGGVVHFLVRRVSTKGTPLVGYQISKVVTVSPSTAATWVGGTEDTMHARLRIESQGQITVAPTSGTALRLDVVGTEVVSSLQVERFPTQTETIKAGAGTFLQVVAQIEDGRRALGLGTLASLISQTPNVCEVSDLSEIMGDGLFALKAKSAGECHLVATLAEHKAEVVLQVHD